MANSTATSAVQTLSDYWQLIVGFLLAVFSIVVSEMFLHWYRKRRDKPRVVVTPDVITSDLGLIFTASIRNFGRTPLLDCANKVAVYVPRLVIEGKVAQFLDGDADLRGIRWNAFREEAEEERGDWEEDLYPFPPDSLFIPLGAVYRAGKSLAIGFFDETKPYLTAYQSMSFSLSRTEAKATNDLHIAFLVWIRGKTTFGDYESKRSVIRITIPNLGAVEECDFTKATISETDLTDSRLTSNLESLGLSLEMTAHSPPPVSSPSVPYDERREAKPSSDG
jgi:hypothetical protein